MIDRPRGSPHPRYPEALYSIDYDYLAGTRASDGGGIDVFTSSAPGRAVTAVCFTVDRIKRDLEAKLLVGCTHGEVAEVGRFLDAIQLSPYPVRRT